MGLENFRHVCLLEFVSTFVLSMLHEEIFMYRHSTTYTSDLNTQETFDTDRWSRYSEQKEHPDKKEKSHGTH